MAQFDTLMAKAKVYLAKDPRFFNECNSHADRLDLWYAQCWQPKHPELPIIQWDIPSSRALATVLGAYLLFLCEIAQPSNPSGTIRSTTLRHWTMLVLFLAGYNIVGVKGGGRNPAVVHGVLPDKSDSLWSLLVQTWTPLLVRDLQLEQRASPLQFWGPDELTLVCRAIDARILSGPPRIRASLLQFKAANQFLLATGNRTGIAAFTSFRHQGNEKRFTEEGKITIFQTARGHYDVEVDLEYLKRFSWEDNLNDDFCPRIHSVTKASNVQLEFATTIIPILVQRKVVYVKRNRQRVFFNDIEEFISAEDAVMYVANTRLPLFRAFDKKGNLTDRVLANRTFVSNLDAIALDANLPGAMAVSYRHVASDLAQIARPNQSEQAAVLNHDGRYSGGGTDMAGQRRSATAATHALIKMMREGASGRANAIPTEEERAEFLAQDSQYMTRLEELQKCSNEIESATSEGREYDEETVFRLRDELSVYRRSLLAKLVRQKEKAAIEVLRTERPETSLADVALARSALDVLRDAPALLVDTTMSGVTTLFEDLRRSWETVPFDRNPAGPFDHPLWSNLVEPMVESRISGTGVTFVEDVLESAEAVFRSNSGRSRPFSQEDEDRNQPRNDEGFELELWHDFDEIGETDLSSTVEARLALLRANAAILEATS